MLELLYSIKYPHGPPPALSEHQPDVVDSTGSGSGSREPWRGASAARLGGDVGELHGVEAKIEDEAHTSYVIAVEEGEADNEDLSSEGADSTSPDGEPEDKRGWNKRRKIRGQKGIDVSLEAGKLVFDKCTRVDGKYRQPKMVIMEDIRKTKTYRVRLCSNGPPGGSVPASPLTLHLILQVLPERRPLAVNKAVPPLPPAPAAPPAGGACRRPGGPRPSLCALVAPT